MKIKNIQIQNVKGQTLEQDLAPINILTGPNAAGKTGIMDAIRVGLVGYLPKLGKTPAATFRLSSGRQMGVCVAFENGKTNTVELERDGKSVKSEIELQETLPPVLLDMKEFFGLKSADRTKYIFDRVNLEKLGVSEDSVIKILSKLTTKEPSEHGPEAVLAIVAHAKEMAEEGYPLQEWITGIMDYLKDEATKLNAQAKQMDGLVKGSLQLEQPPDVDASISDKVKEAEATVHLLVGEVSRAESKVAAYKLQNAARERASSDLEKTKDQSKEIGKLEEKREELSAKMKGMSNGDNGKALEKVQFLSLRIQRAEQNIKSLEKTMADEKENQENELKPIIGECKKCWKALSENIAERQKATAAHVNELQKELKQAQKELPEAQEALKKFHEGQAEASKVGQELFDVQTKLAGLRSIQATRDTNTKLLAQLNVTEVIPNEAEIVKLQEKLKAAIGARDDLKRQRDQWVAYRQGAVQREEGARAYAKTKAQLEIVKAAQKALGEMQEFLIEKTFSTLLEKAQEFTTGILKYPLAYRDGEFGFETSDAEGGWISSDVFSGYEDSLAMVGLSVALAQESSCKIVLLDEMGKIRLAAKEQFLERLEELVLRGTIDQCVIIDPNMEGYPDDIFDREGVSVVDLTPQVVA